MASLRRAQRRFDEAIVLLDTAAQIHLKEGETHRRGQTLVNKGATLFLATHYESAALVTAESLLLIDPADGRLTFTALHNLISSFVMLGRYAQARVHLEASRPLYEEHAGPAERLRAGWLEGLIAGGLGEYLPAVRSFEAARAGFAALELPYEMALVSLDLAALWLGHGQLGEIEALLQEILTTFCALAIDREAGAAVLMLYEAVRRRQITQELVRQTVERLREIQQTPPADPT